MFSKPNKASPGTALQAAGGSAALAVASSPSDAARKPRVASLISGDLTIEGNISGDGELQIDGVVRGDVRVAKLTIGDTGHVEGSIAAETIEVRGRIVGALTSKQVRLYGTAYVDGDITHAQLSTEMGAFFQGRSLKFQRAAAPAPSKASPTPENDPGV